jgi:ribokinase
MSKVVVVGSTNWDIVMYVPELPAPGETVPGGTLQSGLGGKGANQAVAAHRAGGAKTLFISCIGDDDISLSVKQVFEQMGLAVPHVHSVEGVGTGSACIFVNSSGENCIGIASGANAHVTPALIEANESLIVDAGIVLCQLEIPMETVLRVADMCRNAGTIFVLNPAPAQMLSDDLLKNIDILTPNEIELAQLSGMDTDSVADIESAARSLCEKGVGTVIATLGADGCLIVNKEHVVQVPAHNVVAVDTTAAGDVFNGVLVAGLALGNSLEDAVGVACTASAIAVTRKGAISSIPSRQEVDEFA